MSVCAARVGFTRLSRLRLYPAMPHKTQSLHYNHRSGRVRALSLTTVVRLKPPRSQADRGSVGRPVSRLPSPDSDPVSEGGAEEPKLELVPEPVAEASDEEAEEEREEADDDEEEEKESLAGGPTQDPLKLYVRQIGDGPLLTPAEERELARRKDEGDEAAKRKLIESNLRLVMSITRNYVN